MVQSTGFQVTGVNVVDGGTALDLTFSGFQAGMKLVFTIDVDQVLYVDPSPGNDEVDSVDEGAEFQRSHFIADFSAPHFHDLTTSTLFWDKYDANFAAADSASGTTLDLPPDRYTDPTQDQSVLTAGAVAVATQQPLPDSIAGVVYVDNNLNNHQDSGEQGIGNVTLTLFQFDGTSYVSTGLTTKTDAQGNYKFSNVLPGEYRVVETQPVPYFSVGATAGNVNGQVRGVVTSPDIISDISLLGGEDSVDNDFAESLPNSIAGHVGIDTVGGQKATSAMPPIAGVTIQLRDSTGNGGPHDHHGRQWQLQLQRTSRRNLRRPRGAAGGATYEGDTEPGSTGGVVSATDTITRVALLSDMHGTDYDFSELLPVSIAGHVGIDTVGGQKANSSMPPISGVTIQLLDSSGNVIGTTTTDANGNYSFSGMAPKTYGIHEVQPAGYLDGDTEAGSKGGTVAIRN